MTPHQTFAETENSEKFLSFIDELLPITNVQCGNKKTIEVMLARLNSLDYRAVVIRNNKVRSLQVHNFVLKKINIIIIIIVVIIVHRLCCFWSINCASAFDLRIRFLLKIIQD